MTPSLLDRSFGHDGRVFVRLPYIDEEGLRGEVLAEGARGFAVVSGRDVFRYRPDGRLDPHFGDRGRLHIRPSGARLDFEPLSLLSDGHGRFIVGGTTESDDETEAQATVRRYGADGRPDPSFAQDGVFTSDLGFPPLAPYVPEAPNGDGSEFAPLTYGHPHVFLRSLSSDRRGGYWLEGEGVLTESGCATQLDPRTYQSFTAHLLADGDLDPGGGEGGVEKGPVVNLGCGVLRQRPETRSPSTKFIGTPRHARAISIASDVDGEGRTTLLVHTLKYPKRLSSARDYLVRLDRSGHFDQGFGIGGKMRLTVPGGPERITELGSIHVDVDGRILIVGTTKRRGSRTGRYILAEAGARGLLRRSPGATAFSTIGFGKGITPNQPTILGAPRGQVVLWSSLGRFFGNRGFVMARVTPRR